MKKLHVILFLILCSSMINMSEAQNPTYRQKLFYTCKVWGFVKYFHSNVSTCGVNWDSVLIHCLPLIKSAVTQNDFNNALDTLVDAAGPMAITHAPPCDTVPPELSRNLNFRWINNPMIRADVQTMLDTIKNNFRPHTECWVKINPNIADGGYLKFGSDSLILNINDYTNYPDESHRLLELFTHWNIINYFNPYNYIQNQPWDSTLYQNVLNIDSAANDVAFFTAFKKIASNMDDEHVQGFTFDNYSYSPLSGWYAPDNLALKYIPGKYVVVKSGVIGLTIGDEIISINGLTTSEWEDSLRPYFSTGDSASFHSYMETFMIDEAYGDPIAITYYDSLNNIQTISTVCESFFHNINYYPNDTLANAQWRYWGNCNIGYVNAGKMQDAGSDVSTMYSALQNTNAIIFDIRNYPASNAVFDLGNQYLYPLGATPCTKQMMPNVDYPGTYYWSYQYAYPGNANPYTGKVIVLFNEQTESEAEFASMILGELPNSVKIGSQTDGTDGDITYYNLSQQMGTGFTSMGWFYPNGDSTERVGIIPDILIYPTQAGIRAGRDEVLEKALEVAGCPLSIPTINNSKPEVIVYPNPSKGQFTIQSSVASSKSFVEIYNVLGEKVYSGNLPVGGQEDNTIDLRNQPSGVYFYRVLEENGNLLGEAKLVIQK